MELYIVRVNEDGEEYEYEYGNMNHVKAHIAIETGNWKVYRYENGIEIKIDMKEE